ncbi:HlyD family efflux transporter periplasmic adaptor subunit [Echinicola jeungdonensis]|uniref:HlyD family secretion protein n=1 Tax=Echinicola jeungdonensis TaxID=709343 RepID=A0ABV5J7H2_9BACT|nr:HlyD family efflux transporter periplasmic adaptor subunit [Echinicola jeungdonensis]MDN3669762.1 HlyD family efflux transporter periplasmic adaptor subunit [Echinicola jeungdonensis]
MLNISKNSISRFVQKSDYKSFKLLDQPKYFRFSRKISGIFIVLIIICLFLPWTQNIQSNGYVTTLMPKQRPQAIQPVISGRLENWYVREGEFVEKGDTIAYMSDAKSEYFDPNLLERTREQLEAKSQSILSYEDKVSAISQQYQALSEALQLKIKQTRNKILQAQNKVKMDSMDLVAYRTNLEIAKNQLERTNELYNKGLKSLTDLQEKELKVQEAQAKVTVQENKLINQRNSQDNLQIELSSVEQEYRDKLSKSQSDQQSALSGKLDAIANVSKLQNQLSNYQKRHQLYHITAPQSGYITKTITKGIGEYVKAGTDIVTIMPSNYELAVEVYVRPRDLPLIQRGNKVRLRFDGWPAIVISGWPEASTGVFTGRVFAIDRFISENGHYRLLVAPDTESRKWPEDLSVGTGVSSFFLLSDVPVWYELWRLLNGFPADYYRNEKEKTKQLKFKAPIKSVK